MTNRQLKESMLECYMMMFPHKTQNHTEISDLQYLSPIATPRFKMLYVFFKWNHLKTSKTI